MRTRPALIGGLVVLVALVVGALLLLRVFEDEPDGVVTQWDGFRTTGQGLVVEYGASPCEEPTGSEVEETADRVVVTVWKSTFRGLCTAMLEMHPVRVALDEPLGDRPVYDGACLDDGGAEAVCLREPSDGTP